jgi:hypothetical protein
MTHAPRCLKCNTTLPFSGPIDGSDDKPTDGSVAICFECGEALIFEGKGFRYPTPEEFGELMEDTDFAKALALVTLKVVKPKVPVAIIVDPESGTRTILATEPDELCEMCGKLMECRSYGPRKADGVRMRVCFPCAEKDPAELDRAFSDRIEGRT